MKTILITGCSSGFGRETARYFLDRGWQVIATMRSPRDLLPASERLRVLPLDVTDPHSIRRAVEAAGPIDALVNNAAVGLMSVFEGTPMEAVRATFAANTFGAMAVIQAFLPQLRQRRAGVIVNVSSTVTLTSLALLSVYTASKAALNAFTESLALELQPFGVRVRLVLPGLAPETPFVQNAQALAQDHGSRSPRPTPSSRGACSRGSRRRPPGRSPARSTSRRRSGARSTTGRARCACPPAPTPCNGSSRPEPLVGARRSSRPSQSRV